MAPLMAAMPLISAVTAVAGAGLTAMGTIAAGQAQADQANAQAQIVAQQARAQEIAAEYEAKQLEQKGKEELAQGQQEMLEQRRRKNLALSTLQSRAAGSGFTATDPTALNLAGDIAEYGSLQEQMSLYGGLSRRTGAEAAARATRYNAASGTYVAGLESAAYRQSASAAKRGGYLGAAGTLAGGLSEGATLYSKYNRGRV